MKSSLCPSIRSAKTVSVVISFLVVALAGCSRPVDPAAVIIPAEPPFPNDEPETYQAFIVQASPNETVRFLIARDGDKWRIDSSYGTPVQTASLHTDKDRILAFSTQAYAEYESAHGYNERPNMVEEISHGMLNNREVASYEKVGSDDSLEKYRAVYTGASEAVITFDRSIGLPVRKEIYVVRNGERALTMTVTLEDFTTIVDPSRFEIPPNFKKVSAGEMKTILTRTP